MPSPTQHPCSAQSLGSELDTPSGISRLKRDLSWVWAGGEAHASGKGGWVDETTPRLTRKQRRTLLNTPHSPSPPEVASPENPTSEGCSKRTKELTSSTQQVTKQTVAKHCKAQKSGGSTRCGGGGREDEKPSLSVHCCQVDQADSASSLLALSQPPTAASFEQLESPSKCHLAVVLHSHFVLHWFHLQLYSIWLEPLRILLRSNPMHTLNFRSSRISLVQPTLMAAVHLGSHCLRLLTPPTALSKCYALVWL
jgi:hypothetical protein